MSTRYVKRLMELRRRWDVFPFLHAERAIVPAGAAAGFEVRPTMQAPYALFAESFTHHEFRHALNGANAIVDELPTELLWQRQNGAQLTEKTRRSFVADALLGRHDDRWRGLGDGLFIEEDEELPWVVKTLEAVEAGDAGSYGGLVQMVARGYRLYAPGTITPVQKTASEYIADGYALEPFPEGVRLELPGSTAERYVELVFERDYLIDRLTLQPGHAGDAAALIDVKVEADRQLMSDWASLFAVAGSVVGTDWTFPLPITVKKNTRWKLHGRFAAQPGATDGFVDLVLHGHRLHRSSSSQAKTCR